MVSGASQERIVFPKIFALYTMPKSGCEFFEVVEKEGFFVAKCKVLDRFLVNTSVYKCEKLWEDCPFRRLALKLQE